MKLSQILKPAFAALLLPAVLAGCGAESAAGSRASGAPGESDAAVRIVETRSHHHIAPDQIGEEKLGLVARLLPDNRLALTMQGSSSCPLTPRRIAYPDQSTVVVTAGVEDTICTMDISPTTFVIELDPEKVNTSTPVTVHVDEEGRERATATAAAAGPPLAVELFDPMKFPLTYELPLQKGPHKPRVALHGADLLLMTYRSGSCPQRPVDLTYGSRNSIGIMTHSKDSIRGCTRDLRPTAFRIGLDPTRLDLTKPITVQVYGPGDPTTLTVTAAPTRD